MVESASDVLSTDGTAHVTESERFQLLSSERRRSVISVLTRRTTPCDLDDLATDVTERETGVEAPDADDLSDVAVTLHHVHLPKLDDAGIVTYDRDENRVQAESIPTDLL